MTIRVLQIAAGASLGLLFALLLARPETPAGPRPGEEFLLPGPLAAADAHLASHRGDTVRLSELGRGRTLAVFFGYASCPDVCPLTVAAVGRAVELLGERGDEVLGVFVTVDPERDTPAALGAYLSRFPGNWVGLTGSPEALAEAARGYMVTFGRSDPDSAVGANTAEGNEPATGAPYLIDHTGRVFVVREGRILMSFPPMTDPAAMAEGLGLLLGP